MRMYYVGGGYVDWNDYDYDGYSPEDPEDAFEPVGPYTAEDLAFLVDARVEGDEPTWISETQDESLYLRLTHPT